MNLQVKHRVKYHVDKVVTPTESISWNREVESLVQVKFGNALALEQCALLHSRRSVFMANMCSVQ